MVIRMESKNGDVLKGIDQVRAEIQRRLQLHPEQWLQALQKNPGNFADLEQTVHQAFQQMADQMVAGLLGAGDPSDRVRSGRKKSDGESRREVT